MGRGGAQSGALGLVSGVPLGRGSEVDGAGRGNETDLFVPVLERLRHGNNSLADDLMGERPGWIQRGGGIDTRA